MSPAKVWRGLAEVDGFSGCDFGPVGPTLFAVYGKALKLLGEGRVSVMCDDNVKRTCLICGRMRNRVYVRAQDVVLVALRSGMTDDSKADIVHKYTSDEARSIAKRGELPDKFLVEMTEETAGTDGGGAAVEDDEVIMFEDADIDAI